MGKQLIKQSTGSDYSYWGLSPSLPNPPTAGKQAHGCHQNLTGCALPMSFHTYRTPAKLRSESRKILAKS